MDLTENSAPLGIGALSADDRKAYESGHASISDLARKHGVTRQTAWKAIRRRGWNQTKAAEPAPNPPSVSSTPSPEAAAEPKPARPAEVPSQEEQAAKIEQHKRMVDNMSERSWNALAGIYCVFLARANKLLNPVPEGNVSATALNTAVRLVGAAHEGLRNLGIWAPPPEEERIPELIIRTYTKEEETEIRRNVEKNSAANFENGAAPSPSLRHAPTPEPSPTIPPRFFLKESLPSDRVDFEPWLAAIGQRNGRVYLRHIAEGLGGRGTGNLAAIIAEIFQLTGGDPNGLVSLKEPT